MELLYSIVFLLLAAVMIQQFRRREKEGQPEKNVKRLPETASSDITPITFSLWTAYLIEQLFEKHLLEQKIAENFAEMDAAELETYALENGLVTESDLEDMLFEFHNQTPESPGDIVNLNGNLDKADVFSSDGFSELDGGIF